MALSGGVWQQPSVRGGVLSSGRTLWGRFVEPLAGPPFKRRRSAGAGTREHAATTACRCTSMVERAMLLTHEQRSATTAAVSHGGTGHVSRISAGHRIVTEL
jgi:hypothetical protein